MNRKDRETKQNKHQAKLREWEEKNYDGKEEKNQKWIYIPVNE